MIIVKAELDDHEILTDITRKSKKYWGYSDVQMRKWTDLLTITTEYIALNTVYKLLVDNSIIGYYSYFSLDENTIRLDNLFVLPDYIGCGIGKVLMTDFLDKIKVKQAHRIILDSDPNAASFYEKFGFIQVGKIQSSISDRFLPIMELTL